MAARIHLFGASGCGATTLGAALGARLGVPHLEADDYYWLPTDPPFTDKYPKEERWRRIRERLRGHDDWVLSGGSVYHWGEGMIPAFTLVVFLRLPAAERMARLRRREVERYGAALENDPAVREKSRLFLEWAAGYDTGAEGTRTLAQHREWIRQLHCPVLTLDTRASVDDLADQVLAALPPDMRVSRSPA